MSLVIFENKYKDAEKEDTWLEHEKVSPWFEGSLFFSFMHRLLRLFKGKSSSTSCSLSSQMRLKTIFLLPRK